jgi:hypothetical protein
VCFVIVNRVPGPDRMALAAVGSVVSVFCNCLQSAWARQNGLGGCGVWALHLDDLDGVCGAGSLPLINTLKKSLALSAVPRPQQLLQQFHELKGRELVGERIRRSATKDPRAEKPRVRVHNAAN